MQLNDHVALVTGARQGIGRGIALAMARCGADVAINDYEHMDEAQQVAQQVRSLGRRAIVCQADITDRGQVDAMVRQVVNELGKVTISVNNAARSVRGAFVDLSHDDILKTFDVTLFGAFHTSQACVRQMVKQGDGGAVLFISSVHAFIPFGNSVAYNAAKAAVNNMAFTMAEELAADRIRVNVIEPGWINTPNERATNTRERVEAEGKKLPWGRLGTIDEIGKAAAFLCSDDASYITGANLRVDGGFWLPGRINDRPR